MTMPIKESCESLIAAQLKSREDDIRAIAADPNGDDNYDPALSVDTVQLTTVCLSYGGPADYLEIKHEGPSIESVTYRYSDWFDTATRDVPEDSPLYEYARYIVECIAY